MHAVRFLLPTLGGKEFEVREGDERWQTYELECGLVGIPLLLAVGMCEVQFGGSRT